MSDYPKCEELVVAYGGGRLPDNRLACVASVSVRFRSKKRESKTARKMARVKERGGGKKVRLLEGGAYLGKYSILD